MVLTAVCPCWRKLNVILSNLFHCTCYQFLCCYQDFLAVGQGFYRFYFPPCKDLFFGIFFCHYCISLLAQYAEQIRTWVL